MPLAATTLAFWLVLCSSLAMQESPAKSPQDAMDLFHRGQALAANHRLAEAEVLLTEAVSLAPHADDVVTLLAEVKSRLGQNEEAEKLFRQVAAEHPTSAEAHLNLAFALADVGLANEALKQVEDSIRLDPQNPKAHLNRARLLADVQRNREARIEFVHAASLSPGDPAISYFWGAFEKENRRPQKAAELLTKAVAGQPRDVRALVLLAQLQQALGQPQQAIVSWKRAIALDPSRQDATYALAQALRTTDPEQAAQLRLQFERLHAEHQSTERARELGNEAYAAMQEQKWDRAVTALQTAIDLCAACSLQAGLHQRLGLAECHRGNLERGERELRLALSLDPNDPETLRALQWVAAQPR